MSIGDEIFVWKWRWNITPTSDTYFSSKFKHSFQLKFQTSISVPIADICFRIYSNKLLAKCSKFNWKLFFYQIIMHILRFKFQIIFSKCFFIFSNGYGHEVLWTLDPIFSLFSCLKNYQIQIVLECWRYTILIWFYIRMRCN